MPSQSKGLWLPSLPSDAVTVLTSQPRESLPQGRGHMPKNVTGAPSPLLTSALTTQRRVTPAYPAPGGLLGPLLTGAPQQPGGRAERCPSRKPPALHPGECLPPFHEAPSFFMLQCLQPCGGSSDELSAGAIRTRAGQSC